MRKFLDDLQVFISNLEKYLELRLQKKNMDAQIPLEQPALQDIVDQQNSPPDARNAPVANETPEVLLWDTHDHARHSARVIMDEYHLTWNEKNLLSACIEQESQFDPRAIGHPNSDGTIDYGLAQFNNGKNPRTGQPYWIGKGAAFKDIEDVLSHPEKNVRIMVEMYLKGRLHLWSSYSTGAYKKYLA